MITYGLYLHTYAGRVTLLDSQSGINIGVVSGNFELKLNEAGSLEFTVLPFNTTYDNTEIDVNDGMIIPYETTIALNMKYIDSSGSVKDNWWPFVGRPISVEMDMYGNKTVQCEGAMAYLNDAYMTYWDHKYDKVKLFITNGLTCYNNIKKMYGNVGGHSWRQMTYQNRSDGENPFTFTEEYDKDKKNVSYIKVLDGITEHILDAYGGILYFNYYPNQSNDYSIQFSYYAELLQGFDYSTAPNKLPEEIAILPEEYGQTIPSFGIDDNITNITEQYVKTDIWNALMPIGEDAITKMGEDRDYLDLNDVMDINDILSGSFRGYADPIVKAVEFSEVKKGDDSGKKLLEEGTKYIKTFAKRDYVNMRNYTINAIEPCEVFEATNYIVKPGYPVIISGVKGDVSHYPCLSIKHDFFNAQNSEYTAGPFIPQNIINEDISTWK